jgi:hypothetical protein
VNEAATGGDVDGYQVEWNHGFNSVGTATGRSCIADHTFGESKTSYYEVFTNFAWTPFFKSIDGGNTFHGSAACSPPEEDTTCTVSVSMSRLVDTDGPGPTSNKKPCPAGVSTSEVLHGLHAERALNTVRASLARVSTTRLTPAKRSIKFNVRCRRCTAVRAKAKIVAAGRILGRVTATVRIRRNQRYLAFKIPLALYLKIGQAMLNGHHPKSTFEVRGRDQRGYPLKGKGHFAFTKMVLNPSALALSAATASAQVQPRASLGAVCPVTISDPGHIKYVRVDTPDIIVAMVKG